MTKRDRKDYQIMVEGRAVKMADASREQLEANLMAAYDVLHTIEDTLQKRPITNLLDAFISGREAETEKLLEKMNGPDD